MVSPPTRAELERIAHLVSAARTDHQARLELRRMATAFRERELSELSVQTADASTNDARDWPAIGSPAFLARVRNVRSLHVPELLRGRTRLMTHQFLNRVFMGPGTGYKGILLVHETGTGKTRTAIEIVEQHAPVMRNRACVLGPGNVRPQFRAEVASDAGARFVRGRWELAPKFAGSVYANAARRVRDSKRSALAARLDAAVSARYEFFGWTAFANEWSRCPPDRRTDTYSDRVFVIDEAHNLRPQTGGSESKRAMSALRSIAETCFNVKFVLLSATPMFDRAEELVELVNLLRINDDRSPVPAAVPFPKDAPIDEAAVRELVRGYVSVYTRAVADLDVPTVFTSREAGDPANHAWPKRDRNGDPSAGEVTVMCHLPCSEHQLEHTALIGARETAHQDTTAQDTNVAAETAEASNAVFPGVTVGQRGFTSVLNPRTGRYVAGHEGTFGPERLAQVSPKVASIVERAITAEGIVLVYTNFVWAGVKLIAAALEERGFRACEFETAVTHAARERRTGPCYATLSDGADIKRILATARSVENKSGDLIKVLLCTKVVAEGVDLTCVREVHILEGWWNASREEQVIGRAVRFKSHVALPPEKRNVTVYRYGVVMPGDRESIDHEMARIAELKRARIRQVMDIMRSESFDCLAHKREAKRQLASRADLAVGAPRIEHVTAQGVRVTEAAIVDPLVEARSRVDAMCDGADDVLEVGDAAGEEWNVDAAAFEDVVAAVRDALGDGVDAGRIYTLDDLVRIADIPTPLAIRAISRILRTGTPLTPSVVQTGVPRTLVLLDEDEYALSEVPGGRHGIVSIPLTLLPNRGPAGPDPGTDWRGIADQITATLRNALADEAPRRDIVNDMAIDRVLGAGSELAPDAETRASLARAHGLDTAGKLAGLDPERGGLVFVAKRGAVCAHMTRKAVMGVLVARGIPVAPRECGRAATCLYAEYVLRREGLLARTEAARASQAEQKDTEDGDHGSGVHHAVGTEHETDRLLRSAAGSVVHESR